MMELNIRPSSSKRANLCPGSLALADQLYKQFPELRNGRASVAAAEGTVAHKVAELALRNNLDAADYLGKVFEQDERFFTVNHNMVEAVQVYLDYIRDTLDMCSPNAKLLIETAGDLSPLNILGVQGGTIDALIVDEDHRTIYVVDYKHGAGIAVFPEDNPQLMQYALAAALTVVPEGANWYVDITIVQPRHHAHEARGGFAEWFTTTGYLFDWANTTLREISEKAHHPNAIELYLHPSQEACTFCPCSGRCPAQNKQMEQVAMDEFAELLPADFLTAEQRLQIFERSAAIKTFLNKVEESIFDDLTNGLDEQYGGAVKLVRKRSQRKLTDDAPIVLADYLETDEMYTTSLKGIGELTKALKKKTLANTTAQAILNTCCTVPEGSITVALATDKREAVNPSAANEFAHLLNSEEE
jgi:hypothetical protein